MQLDRKHLRRAYTLLTPLLDVLGASPPPPQEQIDFWHQFDIQAFIPDPLTELPAYRAVRDRAVAQGFRFYPAFGVRAGQLATYFTEAFWQLQADRLDRVASARVPGDLWIGIDLEDNAAPSAEALYPINPSNPAHTVGELRRVMQPFIDALRRTQVSAVLYPAHLESGEHLLYIAEALGRDRVEFWTESTYDGAVAYRTSSTRRFPDLAAYLLRVHAALHARLPGAVIRPGIRDLERTWSKAFREDPLRFGGAAPWGFDRTRYDQAHLGTPAYLRGTTPVPSPLPQAPSPYPPTSLNLVHHVWPMQPLSYAVPPHFDAPATTFVDPSGAVRDTPSIALHRTFGHATAIVNPPEGYEGPLHHEGIVCPGAAGDATWGGLRGGQVFPSAVSGAFTLDATFRLPVSARALNPGEIERLPIFGATAHNSRDWLVFSERHGATPTQATVRLYVFQGNTPPAGTTQTAAPYYRIIDLATVNLGQNVRIQVGREGTTWLTNTGRTVIARAAFGNHHEHLTIGVGIVHDDLITQPASGQYRLTGHPGLLLVGTWALYDRLLSNVPHAPEAVSEWARLRAEPAAYWPYGYR